MTERITLEAGEGLPETEGTVVLGYGPQQMDWLSKASKLCGKDAVMDQDLARMAGATFAAGDQRALARLRQRIIPGAIQAEQARHPNISIDAVRWLAVGERGVSSNSIFSHLTGIDALSGSGLMDHPYDVGDFRRCRLLLEQVPELFQEFEQMSGVSPQWAALVEAWPAICAAMDEELPEWRHSAFGRKCPKTQSLIKTAIGR